jgi:sodium/proline symporter
MSGMILVSFLLFMVLFAGVGLSSIMVKKDTTDDYLVAGRGMHPALAALSAVSTWNSGYMFIGFIGYVFLTGYSAIWIAAVSTIGQIIAWVWLYKFIQEEGQERGVRSLSSLVSKVRGAPEAKLAAVLSVLLLSVYAAAQLTAGGIALNVILDLPILSGIIIGFVLVVAYCYAGGIRASIWTDAIQSCVMIIGSTLLCIVALGEVGGLGGLHASLTAIDPTITSLVPTNRKLGISLWILAFFLGGLGVAGQPQVVSRVMTLGGDKERKEAAIWFFVWQTPFIVIMFIIGLTCRAIFLESTFDPEMGLPTIAMQVLSPFWVGLILASIFAATMSTADSQVLACTAAITDDIKPEWSQDHKTTKKVTLVVAAFATLISICGLYIPGGDSVFLLVVLAVYGLGAIFIPLLLIRMCGYEPDSRHTITMMVAAISGVLIWRITGLNEYIFESVPGIGSAFIAHFALCYFREESNGSFFGRYEIPKPMLNQGIVAIVILFLISEVGYYAVAPDSSDARGGVGDYTIDSTLYEYDLGEGSEYIMDSETLTLEFHTDSIDSWGNGNNVVGVSVRLAYNEDETSTGIGCVVSGGNPQPDDIVGTIIHKQFNTTMGGTNAQGVTNHHFVVAEWYNASMVEAGNVSGLSELEIHEQLDAGEVGLGAYSLNITVDVETGGAIGCQHTDDGEEVEYLVQLLILDYTIKSAS